MAIIYTYPKVTNPDGTELIVVSETKNKNSTRLITLQGICDFCGDSGGGACPITYVLKPIVCDEAGNCTPETNSENWLTTCKSDFASFVGFIVSLTNNGELVNGSTSNCFFVDIWNPVPTGQTCNQCCDPADFMHTYNKCVIATPLSTCTSMDDIIYSTTELTNGALITMDSGDACCYTYGGSVPLNPALITPNVASLVDLGAEECSNANCLEGSSSTYKLTPCGDGDPVYTTLDLSIYNGNTIDVDGTGDLADGCWEVSFESGTPTILSIGGVEYEYPGSDCTCCATGIRRYKVCGSDPAVYYFIDVDGLPGGRENPPACLKKGAGEPDPICVEFVDCTEGVVDAGPWVTCDSDCVSDPECTTYYELFPCVGVDPVYTTETLTPGIDGYDSTQTLLINGVCYQNLQTTLTPGTAVALGSISQVWEDPFDCTCCANPDVYEYSICDGGSPVVIDFTGSAFEGGTAPACIKYRLSDGGPVICADTPVCSASAGTTPFSVEACDPNCATDPDCDTTVYYDWRLCSVAWNDASDAGYCDVSGLPTLGGIAITGNATEEGVVYQGEDASGNIVCINVRERNSYTPEPGVNQDADTVLNTSTVFSSNSYSGTGGTSDCDCCGTYRYNICDGSPCASGCAGILSTLYVNPNKFVDPTSPPSILAAYDSSAGGGSGCGCCYELAGAEEECDQVFADGSSQNNIMSTNPQTAGITSGIITITTSGIVDCTSAGCTAAPG